MLGVADVSCVDTIGIVLLVSVMVCENVVCVLLIVLYAEY